MKSSVSTKPVEGELLTGERAREIRKWGSRGGSNRIFPQAHEVLDRGLEILARLTEEGRPLTMASLCIGFGVGHSAFQKYKSGEMGEDYVEPLDMLKTFVERDKNEKGLLGEYNTTLTIFDLKNNHGWRDHNEQVVNNIMTISAEPMTEDEWLEKYGHKRLAAPGRSTEIAD